MHESHVVHSVREGELQSQARESYWQVQHPEKKFERAATHGLCLSTRHLTIPAIAKALATRAHLAKQRGYRAFTRPHNDQ